jgi:hypothetical protein
MISRRSRLCQLTPCAGARNRPTMLIAVCVAAVLAGCSFSERLPGLFDSRSDGPAQPSKSEASKRDASASAGSDSGFDALEFRASAESGDPSKFAADAEGLEPGGVLCGAAHAPVAVGNVAKSLQTAGCRRSVTFVSID